MAIQPIRLFGDPVLRTPAAPVVDFDKELRSLVADLTDTMLDAPGAGLAAPQIGVGLRVFTWYVDGEVGHLVNPDARPVGEETEDGPEGCLSIPGLPLRLPPARCTWSPRASTCTASRSRSRARELLARAIQHETDHLDGVLFVDRLDPGPAQAGDEGDPRGRVVRRAGRRRSRSPRTPVVQGLSPT